MSVKPPTLRCVLAAGALLGFLLPAAVRAASVSNLGLVEKEGRYYFLYDLAASGPCQVSLMVMGGGKSFEAPPHSLTGDIGKGVLPGRHRRIMWKPSECLTPRELKGDFKLEVKAEEAPGAEELNRIEERLLEECQSRWSDGECGAVAEKAIRNDPSLLAHYLDDPRHEPRLAAIRWSGQWGRRDLVYDLLKILEETPLPEGDNTVRQLVTQKVVTVQQAPAPRAARKSAPAFR